MRRLQGPGIECMRRLRAFVLLLLFSLFYFYFFSIAVITGLSIITETVDPVADLEFCLGEGD